MRYAARTVPFDDSQAIVNVEPFVLGRIPYRTNSLAIDLFEGSH